MGVRRSCWAMLFYAQLKRLWIMTHHQPTATFNVCLIIWLNLLPEQIFYPPAMYLDIVFLWFFFFLFILFENTQASIVIETRNVILKDILWDFLFPIQHEFRKLFEHRVYSKFPVCSYFSTVHFLSFILLYFE